MRKILLLAMLAAFGIAGAAYAASTVTNQYTLTAKMTPVKSGTPQHPVSIGTNLQYLTGTKPAGARPNLVQTLQFALQGIRAHTNDFPACGTSRLTTAGEGPTTCPNGSLVGTGYFLAEIGATGKQSPGSAPCRAELSVYNGGNNTLSFYLYERPGVAGECPMTPPMAFVATLRQTNSQLFEKVTIPEAVRHPVPGVDVSAVKTVVNLPAKTKTVKKKKVGLFESISCPANHQRQVAATFTLENGTAQKVTRLVACK